jgi:hypothetical protein
MARSRFDELVAVPEPKQLAASTDLYWVFRQSLVQSCTLVPTLAPLVRQRAVGHPVLNESGNLVEFVGTVMFGHCANS